MTHLEILGIASLSIILVNFGKPADIIKTFLYGPNPFNWRRLKPFDCAFCMSFWIGLGYFTYHYGLTGVLYASISTIIVALLETKI
jgi:hypothetical protein